MGFCYPVSREMRSERLENAPLIALGGLRPTTSGKWEGSDPGGFEVAEACPDVFKFTTYSIMGWWSSSLVWLRVSKIISALQTIQPMGPLHSPTWGKVPPSSLETAWSLLGGAGPGSSLSDRMPRLVWSFCPWSGRLRRIRLKVVYRQVGYLFGDFYNHNLFFQISRGRTWRHIETTETTALRPRGLPRHGKVEFGVVSRCCSPNFMRMIPTAETLGLKLPGLV